MEITAQPPAEVNSATAITIRTPMVQLVLIAGNQTAMPKRDVKAGQQPINVTMRHKSSRRPASYPTKSAVGISPCCRAHHGSRNVHQCRKAAVHSERGKRWKRGLEPAGNSRQQRGSQSTRFYTRTAATAVDLMWQCRAERTTVP